MRYYLQFVAKFVVPLSRIKFVPESSVYWPIIGLGTCECGVVKHCHDPAVQSEFFLRVSKHLIEFIAIYIYIVVSAIAVFRLVDNNLSSSLHC